MITKQTMNTFRARVECPADVEEAVRVLKGTNTELSFRVDEFGEYVTTLVTHLSHDALIAILQNGTDLHVMVDTLEPLNLYTGERAYRY